ncbi:hypothetical protein [Flavobacterium sp. SM2513]|uniref:hypothetical protein n=1 Tax=Flavobacterium sp. SM2513 TaxID=3424766 RepID=UPI003D7FDDDC
MNKFNLEQHPKITSGFTTPENYFDTLSNTVLEKTKQQPKQETRVLSLNRVIYIAAAILVLALSVPFFQSNSNVTLEQIDTNSIENYLSYQTNISQYELINSIELEDLDAMNINLALEDESVEAILTMNPNFENYITE